MGNEISSSNRNYPTTSTSATSQLTPSDAMILSAGVNLVVQGLKTLFQKRKMTSEDSLSLSLTVENPQ
jgi:hypothetical protein